jgi:hypothetical protein
MTQLRVGIIRHASTFLFQVVPAGLYFTIVGACGYAVGGMVLMIADSVIRLA